jgi:hypothetical protein
MPLVPLKLTEHGRVGMDGSSIPELLDGTTFEELTELLFGVEPHCHSTFAVGD